MCRDARYDCGRPTHSMAPNDKWWRWITLTNSTTANHHPLVYHAYTFSTLRWSSFIVLLLHFATAYVTNCFLSSLRNGALWQAAFLFQYIQKLLPLPTLSHVPEIGGKVLRARNFTPSRAAPIFMGCSPIIVFVSVSAAPDRTIKWRGLWFTNICYRLWAHYAGVCV